MPSLTYTNCKQIMCEPESFYSELEDLFKEKQFDNPTLVSRIGMAGSMASYCRGSTQLLHLEFPQISEPDGHHWQSNFFIAVGEQISELKQLILLIHDFYTQKGYEPVNRPDGF